MKKIFYWIALLFLGCTSKNTNSVLQENNLNDTISLYSIEKSEETMRMEIRNANDSIYEWRRKEITDFCELFIDALKSKELKKIEDKIEFPLSVECFVNKEKGEIIDKSEFMLYSDSIFDNSFYREMEEFVKALKKSTKIYDYQIGYDLREEDFFTLGSNYVRFSPRDSLYDEYAIICRFEKRNGRYKLILVFCAG